MGDKKDVVALQEPTVSICAEVDFAIYQETVNPLCSYYGPVCFTELQEAVKENNFKKRSDGIEVKGGLCRPFAILPSVVCACQIDNVEVLNKSVVFDCDKLALCVEYLVCLKLFDKDNKPQCHEFKACFTQRIGREDFSRIPPFSPPGPPSLEGFLSAEGTCVNVEPSSATPSCLVVGFECYSLIFLDFSFDVIVKLFRTHNITVPLVGPLGPRVERIPKQVDRCNLAFPNFGVSCGG